MKNIIHTFYDFLPTLITTSELSLASDSGGPLELVTLSKIADYVFVLSVECPGTPICPASLPLMFWTSISPSMNRRPVHAGTPNRVSSFNSVRRPPRRSNSVRPSPRRHK